VCGAEACSVLIVIFNWTLNSYCSYEVLSVTCIIYLILRTLHLATSRCSTRTVVKLSSE
jgi:hypothetical protein